MKDAFNLGEYMLLLNETDIFSTYIYLRSVLRDLDLRCLKVYYFLVGALRVNGQEWIDVVLLRSASKYQEQQM